MFGLLALIAVLHLTAKDTGKTFAVKPGQAIVLTLASHRGADYFWKPLSTPNPVIYLEYWEPHRHWPRRFEVRIRVR